MGAGLVILLLAAIANAVGFVVMRHLFARLLGARGGWLTVGLVSRSKSLVLHRFVIAGAGPMGCYLIAGALLAVGTFVGGEVVWDETSMRVTVGPRSPAAASGFQDGDRVVSVDGVPTTTWAALRREVSAHAGEEIQVEVERDGGRVVLTPRPGKDGKIGVAPPMEKRPVGIGGAVRQFVVGPAEVIGTAFAGVARIVMGGGPVETQGPVGIVKTEASATSTGLGSGLKFAGALNAYYLFIPTLFALALFPWPMRDRSAGVDIAAS
jgi:regulator of sigma E protease